MASKSETRRLNEECAGNEMGAIALTRTVATRQARALRSRPSGRVSTIAGAGR